MLVVTLKYVFVAMRADNRGEGGPFALLALIRSHFEKQRWTPLLVMLGVLAAALFYGDAMITPAMSVLSAVEGLEVAAPDFAPLVLPLSTIILIALFAIQSKGAGKVGALFGPIVLVYFLVLAALGVTNIARQPAILGILSPHHAVRFFLIEPGTAFLALGSVFLAVTGGEALYADMAHFGRRAIRFGWLGLVYPCLMLNYMGQGALLLDHPEAIANPFYLMAPDSLRLPLVVLATLATIIASQAVITGAFTLTHQAIQLGFLPRMKIQHTSEKAATQIYLPLVNWTLLAMVLVLVWGFGASTNLASAYGIAVIGTMLITTIMLGVLVTKVWRWNRIVAALVIGTFALVDGVFFLSNATKFADGGWFPLLVAAVIFVILTTWARGRQLLREQMTGSTMSLALFIKSTAGSVHRVRGTSVFLTGARHGVPAAMLHNLKHNQVIHSRVVILTVLIEEVPYVAPGARAEIIDAGGGFWRIILHFGFMDRIDIPAELARIKTCGTPFEMMSTSFFMGRQKLVASARGHGMAGWREHLFAGMLKLSESAMTFFGLPTGRVIELGSQLRL